MKFFSDAGRDMEGESASGAADAVGSTEAALAENAAPRGAGGAWSGLRRLRLRRCRRRGIRGGKRR